MKPTSIPIVLALGLANAPMIYGLAAASLPLIIHLLNRRKFRETPWAAMRFLIAAVKKNARRIRIEQWLLLAVRTLVIVLVVSGCLKSERLQALKDYNRNVSTIATESDEQVSHPLFSTRLAGLRYAPLHEMIHCGQIAMIRRLLGLPPIW